MNRNGWISWALLIAGAAVLILARVLILHANVTAVLIFVGTVLIGAGLVRLVEDYYGQKLKRSSAPVRPGNVAGDLPQFAEAPEIARYQRELAELSERTKADPHDDIAARVYRRLRLRHAHLRQLEELTRSYRVHEDSSNRLDPSPGEPPQPAVHTFREGPEEDKRSASKLTPSQRAYHLAVTDLFVEKALAYLEKDGRIYRKKGQRAQLLAFAVVVAGSVLAVVHMALGTPVMKQIFGISEPLPQPGNNQWIEFLGNFARAFTAYGMLVLTAVGLWRYAKASLDQSERLFEKRHALRQGRLFVHLNEGSLSIDEMEKAFNWNVVQLNAFGSMSTDAQAPWGTLAKELTKAVPELVKAGIQANAKNKSKDGDT
jgi:hypothetical protein